MSLPSGKNSDAKKALLSLSEQEGDYGLHELSVRQVQALLTHTEYIRWRTRHTEIPADIATDLDAWVSDLELRLMRVLDICQLFADCIENSETTQSALKQFLSNNGFPLDGTNPPKELTDGSNQSNILGANFICDEEHAAGMAIWIVQALNNNVTQLLESLEAITDPFEFATVFVDNVEVVSWFGSIAEGILWFQEQLIGYYEAAYSPAVEQDLAALIYCSILNDCELSLDKICELLEQNIIGVFGLPPTDSDIAGFLSWMFSTDFIGAIPEAIISLAFYFSLQCLRVGATFPGQSYGLLSWKQIVGLGADETSEDYLTWDDCTIPFCYEYHFQELSDASDFTINAGYFNTGEGIQNTGGGSFPYTTDISINIPDWFTAKLTAIVINAYSSGSSPGAFRGVYYPGSANPAQTVPPTGFGEYEFIIIPNNDTPENIAIQISNVPANPGINIIRRVRFIGTTVDGVNPFGDDNCD